VVPMKYTVEYNEGARPVDITATIDMTSECRGHVSLNGVG